MSASIHPCQKCGACCTVFKVSFESRETSENSFAVPVELTCKVSPGVLAMKYKNQNCARCVALEGHVGKWVGCQIYENRPSPCRNFKAS
ncbi:MAG: YkgJ family cysteine cluster protein, partial [Pseudobdellovibrionaceae bacterium]